MSGNPVGVFWDIENCAIPKNKSASALVNKIRNKIISSYREYEFFCSCDTRQLPQKLAEELNLAGVTVAHVPATAKNASDEKIKEQMTKFVHLHGAKGTVLLISGDVNFAPTLRGFRDRVGVPVMIMAGANVSKELINCANVAFYDYTVFCQDVLQRSNNAPAYRSLVDAAKKVSTSSFLPNGFGGGGDVLNMACHQSFLNGKFAHVPVKSADKPNGLLPTPVEVRTNLIVTGIPADYPKEDLKQFLLQKSGSLGTVVSIANGHALLSFSNDGRSTAAMDKMVGCHLLNGKHIIAVNYVTTLSRQQKPSTEKLVTGSHLSRASSTQSLAESSQNSAVRIPVLNVAGISGKMSSEEVKKLFLERLNDCKPNLITVSNGSARLEFYNFKLSKKAEKKLKGFEITPKHPVIVTATTRSASSCDQNRKPLATKTVPLLNAPPQAAKHRIPNPVPDVARLAPQVIKQKAQIPNPVPDVASVAPQVTKPQMSNLASRYVAVENLPEKSAAAEYEIAKMAKESCGKILGLSRRLHTAWLEFPTCNDASIALSKLHGHCVPTGDPNTLNQINATFTTKLPSEVKLLRDCTVESATSSKNQSVD